MKTLDPRNIEDPSSRVVISMICFGTWVSLLLNGQSAQEAYTYISRYPKDGYDLKAIIGALCMVNVLHAISMIQVNYSLIIRYGSPHVNMVGEIMHLWSFFILQATACLSLLISHFFFSRRVYKLGLRTLPFMLFVGSMLLAGLVLTIYFTTYVFLKGSGANVPSAINIISVLSISFLLNVIITVKLVSYLRTSRTGIRHTDNILNKLTSFSINTGLLTGILTLLPIILMAGPMREGLAWYPVMTLLTPVHTSVVLAAVNSRRSLVDRGSEGVELRSFDLDVSPQPESRSTIEWAQANAEPECSANSSTQENGSTRDLRLGNGHPPSA